MRSALVGAFYFVKATYNRANRVGVSTVSHVSLGPERRTQTLAGSAGAKEEGGHREKVSKPCQVGGRKRIRWGVLQYLWRSHDDVRAAKGRNTG